MKTLTELIQFKSKCMSFMLGNYKWLKIVVAALLIIIAGHYLFASKPEAETTATEQSQYVAVAKGRTDVDGGTINMAASQDGIITEVYVKEGDQVKKGDLLAKQDDSVLTSGVKEAIAAEKQAHANMSLAQVEWSAAKRDYERLLNLYKSKSTSRQTVDEAKDKVDIVEQHVEVAKANVDAAMAKRKTVEAELEQRQIRAPLGGKIVRVDARPGVGASTLNVSTLFVLVPNTEPIVRAELEASFINNIHAGQQVEIVSEDNPDKLYTGKVLRIGLVFGQKKTSGDDPNERADERVVEVITSRDNTPFLIGQRVLVKFLP